MADDVVSTKPVETQPAPAPVGPVAPNKKWSIKKIVLVAIIAAVVILGLMLFAANRVTQGAVNTSNKLINAIQAKDSSTAYALFSDDAKQTITPADFKTIVDQIGPILNTQEKMTSKEVKAASGKSTTGKVVYSIQGTDKVNYAFTVNLVRVDGVWRVQNFDSSKK